MAQMKNFKLEKEVLRFTSWVLGVNNLLFIRLCSSLKISLGTENISTFKATVKIVSTGKKTGRLGYYDVKIDI